MKTMLSAAALAAATLVAGSAFAAGELMPVQVSEIFAPVGFDDNDEVVVVLDGYLPNSCYKVENTHVKVDPATSAVEVTQLARRWPGPCLLALVPFSSTVSLGVLPKGDFTVKSFGATDEKLSVGEATSSGPDDFLYAPVDHVSFAPSTGSDAVSAMLEGRFTNTCMAFEEVKVIDSTKTVEVLPIMKMEERSDCQDNVEIPFRKYVSLPGGLYEGRHLLHVRSLNGRSVNRMFSIPVE
jgi:hypothetical protein